MSELTAILGHFTSIIAVVNPFGVIPVFLSLTSDFTSELRNAQLRKATSFTFLILMLFFIAGTYIMKFFGISLDGMRIAGGLMVMQASYFMLNPETQGRKLSQEQVETASHKPDISFSPLAMPLLSGPGSIAVILGLSSSATTFSDYGLITASILIVAIFVYLVLRISPFFVKLLGKTGLNAMTRMMGFISLCIGVQFIINGLVPILESIFAK